jgi:hypothetical protein
MRQENRPGQVIRAVKQPRCRTFLGLSGARPSLPERLFGRSVRYYARSLIGAGQPGRMPAARWGALGELSASPPTQVLTGFT